MYRIIFLIFIIFSLSNVYSDENLSFIDKSTIENSINDGFYTFAEEKCRNIIPNLSKKKKRIINFFLSTLYMPKVNMIKYLELISKMEKCGRLIYWKAKTLRSLEEIMMPWIFLKESN